MPLQTTHTPPQHTTSMEIDNRGNEKRRSSPAKKNDDDPRESIVMNNLGALSLSPTNTIYKGKKPIITAKAKAFVEDLKLHRTRSSSRAPRLGKNLQTMCNRPDTA